MATVLLLCLLNQQSDQQTIRELIYQAEVYNDYQNSLEALKLMLMIAQPEERGSLVKAIALLNDGRSDIDHERVLPEVAQPQSVIFNRGQIFLMVAEHWLELGDWIGDYYIEDVLSDRILLRTRESLLKEVILSEPLPEDTQQLCIFRDAPAKELLAFLARQAELNAFLPYSINVRISQQLTLTDWLSILDIVSRESNLDWSRRRDNIVFVAYKDDLGLTDNMATIDKSGVDLREFLDDLAMDFDLKLEIDDDLSAIKVDIYAQEQPWDETLDCLAMMNDFNWDLIKERGEHSKLVITKIPHSSERNKKVP